MQHSMILRTVPSDSSESFALYLLLLHNRFLPRSRCASHQTDAETHQTPGCSCGVARADCSANAFDPFFFGDPILCQFVVQIFVFAWIRYKHKHAIETTQVMRFWDVEGDTHCSFCGQYDSSGGEADDHADRSYMDVFLRDRRRSARLGTQSMS